MGEGWYNSVVTKDMAFLLALEKTWKPHVWRQNLANQTVVQVLKPREFSPTYV